MVGDEEDDGRDYSRLEAPLQPDDLYGGDGRETWGRRAEREEVSRKMALRKMAATSLKHRLATMRKTSVTRAVVKQVVARQSRTMIGAQLDPDVVRRRAELCDGPDEAEEDGEGNKSTTTGDADTARAIRSGRHPYTELFMRRYETLLKPHSTWEGATKLRDGTSPGPMERGRWTIPKR